MIQILGLREFTTEQGEVKLYDSHFGNGWRAPSVAELFANLEQYIEVIPDEHRYNMFYTTAECEERKGRVFVKQNILPIDIDDVEEPDQVIDVVLHELGLPHDKVGLVDSGNGVHILIQLPYFIEDVSYFKANRVYYKALCGRINLALFSAGLKGSADPSVFSAARLLRLPLTENRKPNKPVKKCVLINGHIEPLNVDLISLADMPSVSEGDHIHPRAYGRFPDPDTEAVQEKCPFIKYTKENQEKVSEPQWYAMLSIVGRLENGDKLVHEYSQEYSGYHPDTTDFKLEHALEASGPRTCENIDTLWDGCKSCPQWCKISSPIQLVGENYIRTKDTGFYDVKVKNGIVVRDKPNYDDLVKYYETHNKFFTDMNSEVTYKYNGKYWEEVPKLEIHKFAEDSFDPSPSRSMCVEFETKVKRTNLRDETFRVVDGKLNFTNGVLDIDTLELEEHSEEYGFTYVIPYDYTEGGNTPVWDRFLTQVTQENPALVQLINEVVGYLVSGADPRYVQKAFILYGSGGNGKSVLLDVVRNLVGKSNFSAVSMASLGTPTGRIRLKDGIVNITDETPTGAFMESSDFKAIVAGDVIEMRKLYQQPVEWKSMTKLVFACNEMPVTRDHSDGLHRRLVIIPFKARFSEEIGNLDPFIGDKLNAERSGILGKVLRAYKRVKDNGYKFTYVAEIKEERDDYKEVGDTIFQFVEDTCLYDDENNVPAKIAYRCYVSWCEEVYVKPVSWAGFLRRFAKCLSDEDSRIESIRKSAYANGKQTKQRVYTNLRIEMGTPNEI